MIAEVLGGIGLFLVGMVLVTDNLRAAAGDSLRRFLLRFTGGPWRALLSGAAVTAVVQSSSATTVATIGFVGAGLLTFHQALGLIFGANIGTTATGWIVALLGLKFSVSAVALPLVGVGALIKLFARGRGAHWGMALAGFGTLFVGLDVLQSGMEGLSEHLTPSELPDDYLGGRLLLLGLGVLMTTVMQSSSAAVATTLTALHSGTISLPQAAAMVIGINIGTTVTAGLAAIGTSTAAKRTAFAHLLFNGLTGAVAFATLPLFVWAVGLIGDRVAPGDATILLAAFHTVFNILGVVLILPFSKPFAAMVVRVIRHRGPHLTRLLDPRAARQGTMAAEAVRQTVFEMGRTVFGVLDAVLARGRLDGSVATDLDAASAALHETEDYVETLEFSGALSEDGHQRHVTTIHALDHLSRLIDLARGAPTGSPPENPDLLRLNGLVHQSLSTLMAWIDNSDQPSPTDGLRHIYETVAEARQHLRSELLAQTASGALSPSAAGVQLERLRWLREVAQHLWRMTENLQGDRMRREVPPVPPGVGAAKEQRYDGGQEKGVL
ncbi:MAG: Na/Pi cotransporter family protein [Myxococcales bacterium]|nr:Na/Pi cotransporter family protein [Myxococcales bacterium]